MGKDLRVNCNPVCDRSTTKWKILYIALISHEIRRLPRFWGCYVYFNDYLLIVMKDSVLNLIGNVNSLVRGTHESYEN